MATCLDVITRALQIAKVVGVGRTPTAAESELGMDCLQSLYDQWVAGGMFGRLEDTYHLDSDQVEEGRRYYLEDGATLTEGLTVEADGTRQPRDLALYESLTDAGVRTVKLYDRTEWVSLTGLGLPSDAPLAGRGLMGLAAALATSGAFAAAFDDSGVSPRVERLGRQFVSSLALKLGSSQDMTASEYF